MKNSERHAKISEDFIYLLQDKYITSNICEDGYNSVIEEISQSNIRMEHVHRFIENTLPIVLKTKSVGIELVHDLCERIAELEDNNVDKKFRIIPNFG